MKEKMSVLEVLILITRTKYYSINKKAIWCNMNNKDVQKYNRYIINNQKYKVIKKNEKE